MATACKLVAGVVVPVLGLSIAEALIEVGKLCAAIKDRNDKCREVLIQMEQMRAELEGDVDEQALADSRVLEQFVGTVDSFVVFARAHCSKTPLRQWLRASKLADKLRSFESDLAFQMRLLEVRHIVKTDAFQRRMDERTSAIERKIDAALARGQGQQDHEPKLQSMMRYVSSRRLVVEEARASDVVESLAIVKYELEYNGSRHSPEELAVLEQALQNIQGSARAEVPEVPRWFISSDDVEFDATQLVGAGAYSSAHRGSWKQARVVVKRLLGDSEAARRSFFTEVEVWKRLEHPHVVKLYGACHVTRPAFFVSEDCVHGSLTEFLSNDRSQMWRLLFEAAVGLLYIHDQHVVHGDLKCSDILVGADGLAKVSDFGFAFIRSESKALSHKTQTEEVCWKAPECHGLGPSGLGSESAQTTDSGGDNAAVPRLNNPRFASDVYSLGMCILEAFTGELPFGVLGSDEILEKLESEDTALPDRPARMADDAWALVTSLLAYDWRKRPALPSVVDQLQRFADREAKENAAANSCRNCQVAVPSRYTFCGHCGSNMGRKSAEEDEEEDESAYP